jgi:hypothetical protein
VDERSRSGILFDTNKIDLPEQRYSFDLSPSYLTRRVFQVNRIAQRG